jgi:hypothetical protein
MSYLKFKISLISIVCCAVLPLKGVELSNKFKILKQNNSWSLYHNDKPFYIKGAVGWHDYKLLKACGANSVRLRASRRQLDRAAEQGLYAMAGLPVRGERNGMDWDDREMVEAQKQKVLNLVAELKNHPAVMCWAIGNELDWIPPGRPCNPKLWIRLNDIARAIHAIDPDHPVLTVVGTGRFEQKIRQISQDCSDMDLLGINTYGDIQEVTELADTHWPRPYLIAEWGPTGHWQVPKTLWGAPIEQTSSKKAQVSYVFLWGEKQETTHSWYGMFRDGLMTESVGVMKYAWNGTWPSNRAPIVLNIRIEDFDSGKNVRLKPQKNYRASVICYDVEHDTLIYDWDIRPEVEIPKNSYAGGLEKSAKIIPGLINNGGSPHISFITPTAKGPYRLFVQIADGRGNAGYGNIPFYVEIDMKP